MSSSPGPPAGSPPPHGWAGPAWSPPAPSTNPPPPYPAASRTPGDDRLSGPAAPLTGTARREARIELAVVGFVAAAPGLVVGLRGLNDPATVNTDIAVLDLIGLVVASFGPAVLVAFLLWREGSLRLAGFGKPRVAPTVGWGVVGVLACAAAVVVAAVVLGIIINLSGGDPQRTTDSGPEVSATVGSIVAALAIAATAGISEEAVYRGYGITRMEQAGWPRAALWAPWLVWTSQHLYAGPGALLVVGVVGIPLVWLFWWRRSIWPVVVAHALYNIGVFALNLLAAD
ncbi:MAG: CPBP family intramembrane metalloprotease [Acidimicrobiia bacterium]|jgi:membrane protease YdiL (CAAX protease family)|nr:CPBP family intramembrane metalloprotease [Acidimicrobiia bacterium]